MILEGIPLAKQIEEEVKNEIQKFDFSPCLAVLFVGGDEASKIYVNRKAKKCNDLGIHSIVENLPENIDLNTILKTIDDWNRNLKVNGILVQLPLPDHIDTFQVLNAIDPSKDVDGFASLNLGNAVHNRATLLPCTPKGIMEILDFYKIPVEGKNCCVINDTIICGRPISTMLLNKKATVTICHDKTKNIKEFTLNADIVISAVGKRPKFSLDKSFFKKDTVVIDVGVNRIDGKIVGDVDFKDVLDFVHITPPINGVGLLTVSNLMLNTIIATKMQQKLKVPSK